MRAGELVEVIARAEITAGTGQDADFLRGVGIKLSEGGGERQRGSGVDGVADVWPVDRDGCNSFRSWFVDDGGAVRWGWMRRGHVEGIFTSRISPLGSWPRELYFCDRLRE